MPPAPRRRRIRKGPKPDPRGSSLTGPEATRCAASEGDPRRRRVTAANEAQADLGRLLLAVLLAREPAPGLDPGPDLLEQGPRLRALGVGLREPVGEDRQSPRRLDELLLLVAQEGALCLLVEPQAPVRLLDPAGDRRGLRPLGLAPALGQRARARVEEPPALLAEGPRAGPLAWTRRVAAPKAWAEGERRRGASPPQHERARETLRRKSKIRRAPQRLSARARAAKLARTGSG